MAHEYSIQVHDWITEKIKTTKKEIRLSKDQNSPEKQSYNQGQLEELLFIRAYLTDRIDLHTQKYYR